MSEPHNIFISWSGPRSKWVAEALHYWLPLVLQAAKPWMSATDIEKGSRGLNEISDRLKGMKVGVVCLTPENMNAAWILYEAGALSKTIDDKTRLCTYLLGGLEFQDVKPPLGMFQATKSNKEDTRALVRSINKAVSESPIQEPQLDVIFAKWWPELEQKLATVPRSEQAVPKRPLDDMLAEVLQIARAEVDNRKLWEDRLLYTLATRRVRAVTWIYEIRNAGDEVLLSNGGFTTEEEAREAGMKKAGTNVKRWQTGGQSKCNCEKRYVVVASTVALCLRYGSPLLLSLK